MKNKIIQIGIFIGVAVLCFSSKAIFPARSMIIEIPVFIISAALLSFWIYRSKTTQRSWVQLILSCVIFCATDGAISKWIHSDSFPKSLLSEESVQRMEKIRLVEEASKNMAQPGNREVRETPAEKLTE